MDFKFNHDTDVLSEAIGMSREQLDKMESNGRIIIKELIDEKKTRVSQTIEKVLANLSYNETVLFTSLFLNKTLIDIKKSKEKPPIEPFKELNKDIISMLEKLGKKFKMDIKGYEIKENESLEDLIKKLKNPENENPE